MNNPGNLPKSVVSDEELALLTGPLKKAQPSGVDRGFKYRNMVLLGLIVMFTVRNLFFPEGALSYSRLNLASPHVLQAFQLRAFLALLVAAIYVHSYLKDWHFERVGLVTCGFVSGIFVRDLATGFVVDQAPFSPLAIFEITARVVCIYCLLTNALRDNRAPSMPRHFLS